MRVPYNGYTNTLIGQLAKLNGNQVNLQRQLSSGQRVQESYEDPSAVGRALANDSEKLRIQAQDRNLNRAQLIGEATNDTLEQLKSIVDKARVDANNTDGLTTASDFEARSIQADQLIEQGLRILNSKVGGDYLFAGASTADKPFVAIRYEAGDVLVDSLGNTLQRVQRDINGEPVIDSGTGAYQYETISASDEMIGKVAYIQYTGTSTNPSPNPPAQTAADPEFRIGEGSTISPYSPGTRNEAYLDFLNDMVSLRDAYSQQRAKEDDDLDPAISALDPNPNPVGTVNGLITDFDGHQQNVLLGMVEIGSMLQGAEVTSKINESRFNELEELTSRELDIDIAETIVNLNRMQTAYEAALQTGSRIMGLSLLDYIG